MTDLADANILWSAFKRSIKTSPWKDSSQRAYHDAVSIIAELQNDIRNGTYHTGPLTTFVMNERGKQRLIHGNTIRDRTVRHALCDNVLMPEISKRVIHDNAASQIGKGVNFSRKRLKTHLHKFYRKYGSNGYILIIDFSRFYDNILHSEAFHQLKSLLIDQQHIRLLEEIFEGFKVDVSYLSDEDFNNIDKILFNAIDHHKIPKELKNGTKFMRKSVPIGDQISQLIGIWYPHNIDNYCKIVKAEKYYGRYMDDIYIIHHDKTHLCQLLTEIDEIAKKLGITINFRKTQIFKISKNFHFLQNIYRLTNTGKVIEKINKKNLIRMKRKLKKLAVKIYNGSLPLSVAVEMYNSWIGTYKRLMSKEQFSNIQALYRRLFNQN